MKEDGGGMGMALSVDAAAAGDIQAPSPAEIVRGSR